MAITSVTLTPRNKEVTPGSTVVFTATMNGDSAGDAFDVSFPNVSDGITELEYLPNSNPSWEGGYLTLPINNILSPTVDTEGNAISIVRGIIDTNTPPGSTLNITVHAYEAKDSTNIMSTTAEVQVIAPPLIVGPTGATGPQGNTGATGATGPSISETIALSIQLNDSINTTIAPGANVLFNQVPMQIGPIQYDSANGLVTFTSPGTYFVTWNVSVLAVTGEANVVAFALHTSHGVNLTTSAPLRSTQISGSGIINVPAVGVTMSLVNALPDATMTVFTNGMNQAHLSIYSVH